MAARLWALVIGTLALASIRGQFDTLPLPMAGWTLQARLWFMAGFFTILSNLAAAGLMFAVARGWKMPARVAAGMVVSLVMVGLGYHLLLAGLWQPEGMAWWADQGLHTAMPLSVVLWWLAFADKRIGWADLPWWLLWPAIYGLYVLARGSLTGAWPYPFLDGAALGPLRLAVNILGFLAGFLALGAALIGLARSVR